LVDRAGEFFVRDDPFDCPAKVLDVNPRNKLFPAALPATEAELG
jgi:hypothetical protein